MPQKAESIVSRRPHATIIFGSPFEGDGEGNPGILLAEQEFGVVCTEPQQPKMIHTLAEAMGLDFPIVDEYSGSPENVLGYTVQEIAEGRVDLLPIVVPPETETKVRRLCELLGLKPPKLQLIAWEI